MFHFWHRWRTILDTGKHRYRVCEICRKRDLYRIHDGGYQPIDQDWLAGVGEMPGDHALYPPGLPRLAEIPADPLLRVPPTPPPGPPVWRR